jgi:cytochrome c peroxidase
MLQQIFKNKIIKILLVSLGIIQLGLYSFRSDVSNIYSQQYQQKLLEFTTSLNNLKVFISKEITTSPQSIATIKSEIATSRIAMKKIDFWLRYLEPLAYKKINAPLPVEWETEVFEKYEKPYKRIGAGLSLAEMYLDENNIAKDSLLQLVSNAATACNTFEADSITKFLQKPALFFFVIDYFY